MIAALLVTLAVLLLLGVPVAFAIGLSGMAALFADGQIPFELIPQRAFAALNSWALMAVPLFIFAGELMNACGISRRTVEVVGRLRGGLPIVSVVSSMFFASISGSSSASTAAVGSMMIPAMKERGYPSGFATALQAAGGALGPIIPPSIIMIVMGYVTETSIAALFVGGIVPGFLMAGALIAINHRRSRRYEAAAAAAGKGPPPAEGSLGRAILGALPALGMPVVVLGGILAGIFTATEAAGVAVAYGLAVGFFVYRELRVRDLRSLLVSAALRSCVVLFVATSAFLLAWIIAVGRVPDQVGGQVEALAGGQLSFLIACNVILIVVGMFMESISAIIVIMPILFPLALQLGVDPIHFGVLASVNLCIGMVTPPYGATLFVACTIAKKSISEVAVWTVRPVLAMVAVLALMTVFSGRGDDPAALAGNAVMFRRASVLPVLAVLILFAGCRPPEERLASPSRPARARRRTSPPSRGLRSSLAKLPRRPDGRIAVEIYPNNALGNERDVIELAIIGAVELTTPSNAPLATFAPEMLVFDLPYLFRDRPHMYEVLDGPIGRSFEAPLRERGLVLLGYFEAGLRHLMTRDRAIERTEDLAGLKIRTMENPLHLRAFEAFGASPLPMAYGEVYTALEQGVIDGAEAARSNYFSKRFFEVAPNWSEIGWMYLVQPLVMSGRFFSSLAPEDQAAVRAAARKAVEAEREEYQRQDEEALAKLRAAGVRFTHPDTDALLELAREVWRAAAQSVDPALVEAITGYGAEEQTP